LTEHLPILATILAVHILAMATPGVNFFVVTQTSVSRTRRAGIAAALGVAVAATLWAVAALLGLSVVFAHLPWLQDAVKALGGGYLIYLASRLWHSAAKPTDAVMPPQPRDGDAFLLGFFTNLTNPKAAVYYASIFAALVTPDLPAGVRVAAVGIIAVAATTWHVGVACLFAAPGARRVYARGKGWIDRAAGAAFAALGLHLLLQSLLGSS